MDLNERVAVNKRWGESKCDRIKGLKGSCRVKDMISIVDKHQPHFHFRFSIPTFDPHNAERRRNLVSHQPTVLLIQSQVSPGSLLRTRFSLTTLLVEPQHKISAGTNTTSQACVIGSRVLLPILGMQLYGKKKVLWALFLCDSRAKLC